MLLTFISWLHRNKGYRGNSLNWKSVHPLGLIFGDKLHAINQIKEKICNDEVVLINVRHGDHWALSTGYNDDTFYVNDSGYSVTFYKESDIVGAVFYRAEK